jgi:hypothetical protein
MDRSEDGSLSLHDFADNQPHVSDTPNRLRDSIEQRTRAGLISAAKRSGIWRQEYGNLSLDDLREALDPTKGQRKPTKINEMSTRR